MATRPRFTDTPRLTRISCAVHVVDRTGSRRDPEIFEDFPLNYFEFIPKKPYLRKPNAKLG